MSLVFVSPQEDLEVVEAFDVSHNTRQVKHFEKDWYLTREKILEENDEHQTADIVKAMEKEGWKFELLEPVSHVYD